MAGLWRLFRHWGKNGYSYLPDPYVVHIHFISYHGVSHHYLYGDGFLDEHEALHFICPQESAQIPVTMSQSANVN
jgi:hypothetical protein